MTIDEARIAIIGWLNEPGGAAGDWLYIIIMALIMVMCMGITCWVIGSLIDNARYRWRKR